MLLLDEPTVGLDMEERKNFNRVVREMEGERTVLLSTHLAEDLKNLCQSVIILESGEVREVVPETYD